MSPMFRSGGPHHDHDPIRMVLDDETVERLRIAAIRYDMEVEALMAALLHAAALRVDELLGDPPPRRNFR
jgi:hypothetical protein